MTWSSAKQYCANLNEDGYSDWRLPNIDELKTIIDYGQNKFGDNVWFWSSSVQSDDSDRAWYVHFLYGSVSNSNKNAGYFVRCVRNAD